ncbi:MAG: PASTA domain-containing protein, partial [Clostridiales bacterium]|nr:PASTA domain-containing protein [Clostridiales bacterium]
GITMYEMVTGQIPFDGENTVSIALAHLEDAIVPPSVYNPEIPVSLERIILRCCEKKPEFRYQNADDLIADLREALIHPDGETIKETSRTRNLGGETVVISDGDLAMIKGRVRPELPEEDLPSQKDSVQELNIIGQGISGAHLQDRQTEPEEFEDSEPGAPRRARRQHEEPEDGEASPGIERLLAGAGIVVAIIIVAVLITVVLKLGGLFQSGSGLFAARSTTEAAEEETEEYSLSDTEVYMPDVRNLPADIAEERLSESFLNMKSSYDYFDDVEEGRVADQDPEPDTVVAKGSNVTVVISYGTDKISLADLEIDSLDAATAQKLLERKSLTVVLVEEENETVEAGDVIRYEPELVEENGTVTLYVSSGPHVDTVTVPNITGQSESDAIALLAEAGLSPGETQTAESDTVTKGYIISQGTEAGTQIEPGGMVNYVVSSGAKVVKQRYVAAISETYDLSNLVGPGAGTSSVTVLIRLRQGSDSDPVYKILMEETTIKGDLLLPVNYTSIESIDGSNTGQIEIVDVDSGEVIKTYPLTFLPMN